ncbi:MAG: hypothetical protein CVU79_12250 [Elusimicrobia bacterium HGW-Elusimicrobia-3]|nr:MAG: hypothetical protein CVU79_12250 [Elusimicrobia bacterium HGW-Elusimicrobia-3]
MAGIVLLLAALLGAVLLVGVIVPELVRWRLGAAVRAGCATCELSLGAVRVHLVPPALACSRIRLTAGITGATSVNLEAGNIYAPVSLSQFMRGRIRAGIVVIDNLNITVKKGDQPAAPPPAGPARPLDLELEGVTIRGGSFLYVRESPGMRGSLGVSGLSAALGPVGTSERLRGAAIAASAEGVLADTGKFRLEVKGMPFPAEPELDVTLRILGQDLQGFNRYFKPLEGLSLKGTLLEGRSETAIRGRRLDASVYLRYRGLGLHLDKTKERGALSSYFQNLLAGAALGRQNAGDGGYDRTGTAKLERQPGEGLAAFTLRGMKEAALQVAKQGGR